MNDSTLTPSHWDSGAMFSGITAETARANVEHYNNAQFEQALLKPAVKNKIREIEQEIENKSKNGGMHLKVDLELPLDSYYWRHAIMLNAVAAGFLGVLLLSPVVFLAEKLSILPMDNQIITLGVPLIVMSICFFFLIRKTYRENNKRKAVGLTYEDWECIAKYFRTKTQKYKADIIPYYFRNDFYARYLWISW